MSENGNITMVSIDQLIKQAVSADNASVVDIVVQHAKSTEIKRRAGIVSGALQIAKDTEKELRKMKEDVVTYIDGKEHKAFSQDLFKKKQELEKKLADIDVALTEAIEKGDYQKLEKFSK
jgi:hypothetical protein